MVPEQGKKLIPGGQPQSDLPAEGTPFADIGINEILYGELGTNIDLVNGAHVFYGSNSGILQHNPVIRINFSQPIAEEHQLSVENVDYDIYEPSQPTVINSRTIEFQLRSENVQIANCYNSKVRIVIKEGSNIIGWFYAHPYFAEFTETRMDMQNIRSFLQNQTDGAVYYPVKPELLFDDLPASAETSTFDIDYNLVNGACSFVDATFNQEDAEIYMKKSDESTVSGNIEFDRASGTNTSISGMFFITIADLKRDYNTVAVTGTYVIIQRALVDGNEVQLEFDCS